MTSTNTEINQKQAQKAESKPVVIYGGPLFDGKGTVFEDGAVFISKGKVVAAGSEESVFAEIPKTMDMEVFDTLGCMITPGFIDLHQHLYRSLALGLPEFPKADQKFWQKYEQCLDEETIQLAVLTGLLRSIKAGVTTVFDMHSSPLVISHVLKNIASVVSLSGIKAVLSYGITENSGEDVFVRSLEENQHFISNHDSASIKGMLGLHYSENITEKALTMIAETAKKTGIHIVFMPDTNLNLLDKYGLLSHKTIIAGHLPDDKKSFGTFQKSGATYVHYPSYQNYHELFLKSGIETGAGISGYSQGVFQYLNPEYFQKMLDANARFAGRYFKGKPGIIEKGSAADVVVFDYVPITPITDENYFQHFLLGMNHSPAKMVMADGHFIYNDYTFLTIDEEIIIEESQIAARRLFEKFENV